MVFDLDQNFQSALCNRTFMKDSWKQYAAERAPRYTSYPSALHFDESVNAGEYTGKLKAVGLYDPLSIYVHIPFCKQLCWYCGCNMRVENSYPRALYYIDALLDEIRIAGGFLGGNGRPVNVHFGGGTPNFLRADDIGRILNAIELELGLTDDARLAIELDPRLVREGDIDRLAAQGFGRMSLGVQDLNLDVQNAVNRVQSYELIEGCVSDMRQAGVNDVSFDILYGLPKQTLKGFEETLTKCLALSPDRFSVFGYAHLPAALSRQRMIDESDLPDGSLRAELSMLADAMIISAGYQRVGFDHYAKPDNLIAMATRQKRLRRNFQGFTDDIAETTLGFGTSAISFVNGLYAQNHKDIRSYSDAVKSRRLPTCRGVERTAKDWVIADVISELLCDFETDIGPVLAQMSLRDRERIAKNLAKFERDGVIHQNGNKISMNAEAHGLCRAVAAAFDPYVSTDPVLARAI